MEVRNGGWQDFVLSANGDVYWKRNPGAEIQHVAAFIDIPLYFSGTTNGGQITQFFDLDTRDCGVVLMYDEGNNRVVGRATRFNSNSDSRPVEFTYAPDDPNVVKLTDLTGYKIMYLGDYAKGSGLNIILKEESTGNYYYQNMGFIIVVSRFLIVRRNFLPVVMLFQTIRCISGFAPVLIFSWERGVNCTFMM